MNQRVRKMLRITKALGVLFFGLVRIRLARLLFFISCIRISFRQLKALVLLFVFFSLLGVILLLGFLIYLERTLPDPETIIARQVKESTKIYDRTGKILLYDIYGEEKRTIIPWEQIPKSVRDATLAAEDNNFYSHPGFDFRGVARAFLKNLESGSVFGQGGSTITQQLVGNALVGREKSYTRKIRELILSVEVERRFSKDEIFWMYLNQIPYGSNAYGIEAAAKAFFNKKAGDLTLAESALLASLVKATTYLSPHGSHVAELTARKDFILHRMHELGYIKQDELQVALQQKLVFSQPSVKLAAPHFVIMVQEYLLEKYGRDSIEGQGFKVITTLDTDLQQTAETLVEKYVKINREKYKASNAALVAIDPKNGDLLSLVGSANYFDTEGEGNFNVATALRQPGSAFKPFAYAAAFKNGYPDSTVLFDLKTEFNPYCSASSLEKKDRFGLDCYHPQNYDGTYRGPVTMRQALAQSLNVPSVKTLYLAGINNTIRLAQDLGITSLTDPSRYGLSLVLGGAEVQLVDIVSAYGVFANDGIRNSWRFIKKIELANGTVLEEAKESPNRVLDPQIARLVNDVLSDNSARSAVFGHSSPLYVPGHSVAAKTGTTQENRDAWVIGYTPSLTVGVWTGNNKNQSMTQAGAGISASGPLWREFLTNAIARVPNQDFVKPDPATSTKLMLNGEYRLYGDPSVPSQVHSILYYVRKEDPLGPYPSNPYDDPQFPNWETSVRSVYGF